MATKRINFSSLTTESVAKLSDYHVAYVELRVLADAFKANKKAINDKIDKVCEDRKNAMANGMSVDDATRKFDLVPLQNQLRALEKAYADECKPYKDAKKAALDLISDELYYGYLLADAKGSFDVTSGTIEKGKKEIKVEKSYKATIKDFLVALGCGRTEDDKALAKFVNLMSVRTCGNKKCNKGYDNYVSAKSASQYKELFMLNILQYLVSDLGVLVVDWENGATLSVKQYDAE